MTARRDGWVAAVLLATILALPLAKCGGSAGPRVGPLGRITVLYIGDGWGPSPVAHFLTDPSFRVVSVPASEKHVGHGVQAISRAEMLRFVRIYMPRTYAALTGEYDYIAISDANRGFFGQELAWMRRSVEEVGLGIIMVGGHESFGGWAGAPSWADTDVAEILPVTMNEPKYHSYVYKVRPALDHPFTRSLPWQTIPTFRDGNHVALKDGATLLLTTDVHPYPPLSCWRVGRGMGIAHSMDWTPGGGELVMRWEYYPDYVANIAFLAVGREIPDDPQLVHRIRSRFFDLGTSLRLMLDIVAFAEKFGANTASLEVEIAQVHGLRQRAEQLYVEHSYEESEFTMDRIDQKLLDLQNKALQLKDQALFWVYLIEWLSVTGVSALSFLALWTVMIRRWLYREVATTRGQAR